MQQIYPNLKYNVSVYNTKSRRTVSLAWDGVYPLSFPFCTSMGMGGPGALVLFVRVWQLILSKRDITQDTGKHSVHNS